MNSAQLKQARAKERRNKLRKRKEAKQKDRQHNTLQPGVPKTREERDRWATRLKNKILLENNLSSQKYPEIRELLKRVDQFVDDGIETSGKIRFDKCPSGAAIIDYKFNNKRGHEPVVNLLGQREDRHDMIDKAEIILD